MNNVIYSSGFILSNSVKREKLAAQEAAKKDKPKKVKIYFCACMHMYCSSFVDVCMCLFVYV